MRAVVRVASDFRHHRVPEDALRRPARWNVCRRDDERARAGKHDDLCYFPTSQPFPATSASPQDVKTAELTLRPGTWYLEVDGDLAGRTQGFLVDADVLASQGATSARAARRWGH